nr:hypothetical protein [Lysinibacillus sphaericus]
MMKQEQLIAIKERVAKATQGPWKVVYDTDDREHVVDIWFDGEDNGHAEIHDNSFGNAPDNAKFISHSREDVPALVAEVERLHKALEEIMEVEEPIMEGWETPAYKIAQEALGGEAHE